MNSPSALMAHLLQAIARRPLVLHFDINRTIVEVDPAGGKSLENIINTNVAACAYGTVEPSPPSWTAVVSTATTATADDGDALSHEGSMTYDAFVDNVLCPKPAEMDTLPKEAARERWNEVTAERRRRKGNFTDAGQPGSAFRSLFDLQMTHMAASPTSASAPLASSDGAAAPAPPPHWYVIPAFYELLSTLSELQWRVAIVFRTFGTDLPEVVTQMARFVSGQDEPVIVSHGTHPAPAPFINPASCLPAIRGALLQQRRQTLLLRGGPHDRTIHIHMMMRTQQQQPQPPSSSSTSTFIPCWSVTRSQAGITVSWATTATAAPEKRFDDATTDGDDSAAVISTPLARELTAFLNHLGGKLDEDADAVRNDTLTTSSSAPTSPPPLAFVGLKDYYPWWAANAESGAAGKLFPVFPHAVISVDSAPSCAASSWEQLFRRSFRITREKLATTATAGSHTGEDGRGLGGAFGSESTGATEDRSSQQLRPLLSQVFFDDNVRFSPATVDGLLSRASSSHRSIVDLRDAFTGEHIADEAVQRAFMVAVEPMDAITDRFYFVRQLAGALRRQDAFVAM